MIPRKHPASLIALARVIVCWLSLAAAGAAWAVAEAVGEVSFAIGVSRVISEEGRASAVSRAMPVHVGDRIETERGGHIHVRFVDGAYVAVRPGSRLTIETYRYNAANPQDSAIRFRLEEGVVRAISGKGAEAARERFRLNTPIAALGVRGTDFVVQTEPERVRVAIYSGAIVLTPLGEGCRADALGPCATAASRTLSADMGQVMLEFQRQQVAPRIVPINGMPPSDRLNPPAPEEPRGGTRSSKAASETNTDVLAVQAVAAAQELATSRPPPLPPALVWGHWPWVSLPGDTNSQSFAEASAGRKVTVGNDFYGLFRTEPPFPVLVSNLGKVDFTLRDAQVHLVRGGVAELGRVDGAWLSVDFAARQFATSVAMSHPQAGAASLQLGGNVRDDGIFAVRTADGRVVAGALTVDGKEAGYLFQQPVTGGSFMGITRWGR